jgi:hypothetical protein
MKTVGAAPGFNSRWWNDECKAAAAATREGFWTEEEACHTNRHLKKVVREAKRNWANDYITMANVWEVATWRHGVTVSPSPQSKDEENEKLHKLREYARDFRRQHTTDAEQFDWDSDDGDYGLAIGRLVVT